MTLTRMTNGKPLRLTAMAVLLAGTTLGGFAAGHAVLAEGTQQAIQPTPPQQQLADFSGLVKQVKPAVVSITTMLRPQDAAAMHEGPSGMHGMPSPFPFGMAPEQPQGPVEARGSGFIINANGTVVTNTHVVKGAKSVTVTMDDGTTLPAKVVGTDPRTDLAVLRVDAKHPLPFLNLGDSSKVEPGQWVVAVGNPYGLDGSVTAGIVSARGRDIGNGPYDSFIQIDAPINRGNSGGPLFTQDGKVVGVNTAILSPTGGSIGIGFAIPSNLVTNVVQQIEQNGHVTRGFLGVATQPVTPDMAKAMHLPGGRGEHDKGGALVANVDANTPAARAGLQPGDVIQSVNGKAIDNPRDLAVEIAAAQPGSETSLGIIHEGEAKTVKVTLGTQPGEQTADRGVDQGGEQSQHSIGVALAPLTPDLRQQLQVPEQTHGAVVAEVKPGSPAAQAGLEQGDILLGVGGKRVGNPREAAESIRTATKSGEPVALQVMRDGHSQFVAVNPGAPDMGSDSDQG